MAEIISETNEEPAGKRSMIGTVLIIGLVVFTITLGVVIALALIGPAIGPGVYSSIGGSI